MPKTKGAKKAMQNFKDQYGDKKGEQIYYATAKKQGRNEKTFKKECKLIDDLTVMENGVMTIIPAGTVLIEMALGTGAIAMVPGALPPSKPKKKNKKKKEIDEGGSNSQVSQLQQDH